jgi:hypothetical protein
LPFRVVAFHLTLGIQVSVVISHSDDKPGAQIKGSSGFSVGRGTGRRLSV